MMLFMSLFCIAERLENNVKALPVRQNGILSSLPCSLSPFSLQYMFNFSTNVSTLSESSPEKDGSWMFSRGVWIS